MPGSTQIWHQLQRTQNASGTLTNTYTTAKSVINAQALLPLYAGYWTVGTRQRVRVRGALSNIVTTPGTVSFQIMMGSIIVWTSGAIQLNATAHTTLPFTLDVDLVCQAEGSGTAAKLLGVGTLTGVMFTKTAGQTDGANTETVITVPVTAPAQGTGFDSTISNIEDFWVGFSISNAGNGIQIHTYDVESLN